MFAGYGLNCCERLFLHRALTEEEPVSEARQGFAKFCAAA